MRKPKKIWTRAKPTWRTVKGGIDWSSVDVQALLENEQIYTALIYATKSMPWHRQEDEYAYLLQPGYVLLAPQGYDLDEQHDWRQDHYSDPRVVATWAYDRSSAERSQLKNLEIQEFKTQYGENFRPSKKDPLKPVVDENYIKQLIAEGKSINEIHKETRVPRQKVYRIYWTMHRV